VLILSNDDDDDDEHTTLSRDIRPLSLSPTSTFVLNHISSHFLIPLSDSFLICTVPAQWPVILDTINVIIFNILARHCCPLSPSSAVVLNHISSHFLIPLSDSSHLYSARAVTCHFGHNNRFYI